jgi:hypothetical protein
MVQFLPLFNFRICIFKMVLSGINFTQHKFWAPHVHLWVTEGFLFGVNGPAVLLISHFHLVVKVKAAHSHTSLLRPKFIYAVPVFFTFIGDSLMHIIILFSYSLTE